MFCFFPKIFIKYGVSSTILFSFTFLIFLNLLKNSSDINFSFPHFFQIRKLKIKEIVGLRTMITNDVGKFRPDVLVLGFLFTIHIKLPMLMSPRLDKYLSSRSIFNVFFSNFLNLLKLTRL